MEYSGEEGKLSRVALEVVCRRQPFASLCSIPNLLSMDTPKNMGLTALKDRGTTPTSQERVRMSE